jgi:hypothetical protein
MFVLDGADAAADAVAFAGAGIGPFAPFSFERSGRSANGTETHVAFTLAFAMDERIPDASFFVCQQHFPAVFWSPAMQQHTNGAINVTGADLAVDHPTEHAGFLGAFTRVAPDEANRYKLAKDGELRVVPAAAPPGFTGFEVTVPDLAAVAERLRGAEIGLEHAAGRIMIFPESAHGTTIAFRQAS